MSRRLFSSPLADDENTNMAQEYESYHTPVPTVDVIKQIAISTSREPAYKNNNAAVNTLQLLEQDFSHYAKDLLHAIFAANKERNSSDPDVLMFRCRKLDQAAVKFSEVSRKLIAAGRSVGCVSAEELINKMYPSRLQDQVNALSVLRNRCNHLTQIKAQSELDESRKNLETLLENAYYVSHNANDFLSVDHIITKIDSSVTQMSQQLKSLAATDNDLAKADDSLINKQAPLIISCLHTRKCLLERRKVIIKLKNEKKAAKAPVVSVPCEPIPGASEDAKARAASALRESNTDTSEASAVPIVNNCVAAQSMRTQGDDKQFPKPHALSPNAIAFTPSVCKKI